MKKTMIGTIMASIFVVIAISTGCGTTEAVPKNGLEPVETKNKSNISVDAYKTVIVDWAERTTGIKDPQPSWLTKMIHGNGYEYCDTYGNETGKTRKFITPAAAFNMNLNNALNEAQVEAAYAVGAEMAMSINGTMGDDLTDGEKAQVRTICESVKADITGLRNEGNFWQLLKTTDDNGNVTKQYLAYQFYSMSKDTYNELLNVYLVKILQNNGLDKTAVNRIAAKAQEILDDGQRADEKVEKQHEREQERMLAEYDLQKTESNNTTRQTEAKERTAQVQSKNEAAVQIAETNTNADVASQAAISPALAAALRNAQ